MTKNAFKDDFLKKGNKSRNGKETPNASTQREMARSRQRERIVILRPFKFSIKGEGRPWKRDKKQSAKKSKNRRDKSEEKERKLAIILRLSSQKNRSLISNIIGGCTSI